MKLPKIDKSKGFDVVKGKRVLAHFDNYDDAWALAKTVNNSFVRYFTVKPKSK